MGRGIERKEIFYNDTDHSDFIDRLAALVEEGAMDIYAWGRIGDILLDYWFNETRDVGEVGGNQ